MVRKIRAKLVLRLRAQGLSRNAIARSQGMSKHSVIAVFDAADRLGVGFGDVAGKDDDEVYAMLFPGRNEPVDVYERPDWDRVHRELGRVGVTLRLLHREYRDSCRAEGRPAMGYDRFCKLYARHVARLGVTSRVERKAGRSIEVDWAGPTMRVVDPVTGEASTAYLFVGVLPYSRMPYVEATSDMKEATWLRCHVRMFSRFGGSTPRLVCDNLRTGVVSHPRDGEVVLNEAYRALAEHYSSAVLPGRVRRPRDKPNAENEVWQVTKGVVGAMRDRVFGSLDEVVFSQVGVSVFVRYFFRFWAWVCRPGVFYWFWGLPNMSAWLMRWLCPVNSMSRPWWTMRSMIEAASLSSAKIVPHLLNSMFVVKMMLLLS